MLKHVSSKHTYLLKKHGNKLRIPKIYDVMSSYIGFKKFLAKMFDIL